ncbi:unnamed protein product, partial [Effrenium voratum]
PFFSARRGRGDFWGIMADRRSRRMRSAAVLSCGAAASAFVLPGFSVSGKPANAGEASAPVPSMTPPVSRMGMPLAASVVGLAVAMRKRNAGAVARKGLFDGMEAGLERKLQEQLQRRSSQAAQIEKGAEDLKRKMEEQLEVERRVGEELRMQISVLQEIYTEVNDKLEMSQIAQQKMQASRNELLTEVQKLEERLMQADAESIQRQVDLEGDIKQKEEKIAMLERQKDTLKENLRQMGKQVKADREVAEAK